MLSEYIENLLNTNEFELEEKQKEYNELLQQQQEIESWIENLKKENDLEQNIFSPRIAAAGGLGKLNQARTQLQENEKQQGEIQKQLEELKKKQREYQEMLAEADKESQNSESREKSQAIVNVGLDAEDMSKQKTEKLEGVLKTPEGMTELELEESEETDESAEPSIEAVREEIELETPETATKKTMEDTVAEDCESMVRTTGKLPEEKTPEKDIENEKQAEQSSLDLKTADITARIKEAIERKNRLLQADEENEMLRSQVNEFQNLLSNLYKKTELCMALMNGDRNKCRKELQEMKKMIKKYSEQMK